MAYFPLFISINKVPCLVVGGGMVALRKIRVLLDFGAEVTVVATRFLGEIVEMDHKVKRVEKSYEPEDLNGYSLVIAATNDKNLNHRISQDCRDKGIFVNAVDQQEDCDFILPAYLRAGDVVAAFSSGGNSPVVTQYLKEKNRDFVTKNLGEITEYLGSIREKVKAEISGESRRKQVYLELLEYWKRTGEIPPDSQFECMIQKYKQRGERN